MCAWQCTYYASFSPLPRPFPGSREWIFSKMRKSTSTFESARSGAGWDPSYSKLLVDRKRFVSRVSPARVFITKISFTSGPARNKDSDRCGPAFLRRDIWVEFQTLIQCVSSRVRLIVGVSPALVFQNNAPRFGVSTNEDREMALRGLFRINGGVVTIARSPGVAAGRAGAIMSYFNYDSGIVPDFDAGRVLVFNPDPALGFDLDPVLNVVLVVDFDSGLCSIKTKCRLYKPLENALNHES
ncbi:hypothetical protein EVAR_59293_1 [Eumeta japonica]|uniref:Uncharacterized protein n=1 Tax=Eumeta variegata TaxID=151549 RepID=A0A4C1YCV6_EUMVA|nr:hypothetical protein EVAR_59293_1 [Eumeta japonica]